MRRKREYVRQREGNKPGRRLARGYNFDSWIVSNKMAPSISLPVSRDKLWDVLCKSASTFVSQGPKGESLYLPLSLTNSRKRRFAAGAREGPFPVTVDPLDAASEHTRWMLLPSTRSSAHLLGS